MAWLLQRTVWRPLRRRTVESPRHLAIPLLHVVLDKTMIQNDACTHIVTAALVRIDKQTTSMPTDTWMDKDVAGIHNGRLRRRKKARSRAVPSSTGAVRD